MGYALVGSAGAVTTFTSGTGTPAYGQTTTANNLLILLASQTGTDAQMSNPSGWSLAESSGAGGQASGSAYIWYKIAAGSDAQPSLTFPTGGTSVSCLLAEFSGNATSSPVDQIGAGSATGTSNTPTGASADAKAAELVIGAYDAFYSTTASRTLTAAINNGATATNLANNSAASAASFYNFTYGITTGNSVADIVTFTNSTATKLTSSGGVMTSFKLPFFIYGRGQQGYPTIINQAPTRASYW
jgi:hypothetical protein